MGLVTSAAACPSRTAATARSIASIVPAAVAGSGCPDTTIAVFSSAMTGRACSKSASASCQAQPTMGTSRPSRRDRLSKRPGSAMQANGGRAAGSSSTQAFKASSGPIPAGSPCVRASSRGDTFFSTRTGALAVILILPSASGDAVACRALAQVLRVADLAQGAQFELEHHRPRILRGAGLPVGIGLRIGDVEHGAFVGVVDAEAHRGGLERARLGIGECRKGYGIELGCHEGITIPLAVEL